MLAKRAQHESDDHAERKNDEGTRPFPDVRVAF